MTDALPIEPRWNLDQTLIWIVSRDIELVAAASSRLDDHPRTWVPYLLEAPDYGWPCLMPNTMAETELLHALQRSDLQARSEGADVDPDWFCNAEVLADGPQTRAYLHGDGRKEPKFSSAEVRRIWPADGSQAQEATTHRTTVSSLNPETPDRSGNCGTASVAQLEEFTDRVAKEWRDAGEPPRSREMSERNIVKRGRAEIPNASDNQILKHWREFRPDDVSLRQGGHNKLSGDKNLLETDC